MSTIGLSAAILVSILVLHNLDFLATLTSNLNIFKILVHINSWVLLPSLICVVISGLISIAVHTPFHNAGWAWLKAALGLVLIEGTLISIIGKTKLIYQQIAGIDGEPLNQITLTQHSGGLKIALWVILALIVANIILGIWRPKFRPAKIKR